MRCSFGKIIMGGNVFLAGVLAVCFLLLISCNPVELNPPVERIAELNYWLDNNRTTPAELIVEAMQNEHSLVIVQEELLRVDTLELLSSLIPLFLDQGVDSLGITFFDARAQKLLDEYCRDGKNITPQEVLVVSNASLGYAEYQDFLGYIRAINSDRWMDSPLFNIVALGSDNGADTMSIPLVKEFLRNNRVALWVRSMDVPQLLSIQEDLDGKENEVIATNTPVIILHFDHHSNSLQWDGLVEFVHKQRAIRDGSFAFYTDEEPFLNWEYHSEVMPHMLIVTNWPCRVATAIPYFITMENIDLALDFFSELRVRKTGRIAVWRMNRFLLRKARQYKKSALP